LHSQRVQVHADANPSEQESFHNRCTGAGHRVQDNIPRHCKALDEVAWELRRELGGKGMPGMGSIAGPRPLKVQICLQQCLKALAVVPGGRPFVFLGLLLL